MEQKETCREQFVSTAQTSGHVSTNNGSSVTPTPSTYTQISGNPGFAVWEHQHTKSCPIKLGGFQPLQAGPNLHFSIFTATLRTESSLPSPKAVASTTFPKAPAPRVFPAEGTNVLIRCFLKRNRALVLHSVLGRRSDRLGGSCRAQTG